MEVPVVEAAGVAEAALEEKAALEGERGAVAEVAPRVAATEAAVVAAEEEEGKAAPKEEALAVVEEGSFVAVVPPLVAALEAAVVAGVEKVTLKEEAALVVVAVLKAEAALAEEKAVPEAAPCVAVLVEVVAVLASAFVACSACSNASIRLIEIRRFAESQLITILDMVRTN